MDFDVQEVERAWQEPGERCFQVRAGQNRRFKLCYNEATVQWSLTELDRS